MQLTGNYGLKKPEQHDAYNIQNENDNMDIIDRELNNISAANKDIYLTTNIGNNYSVLVSNLTTLTDGYPITVKFNAASTGAITVNPSKLGAKSVVDYFNKPVTNVRKDLIANLRYDATNSNFQLLGKGGGGNVTADKMLNSITATGDNGPVVGNIPSKTSEIIIPGTTDQIISANQYLSGPQTIKGTPSLIPSNIIDTANVFGVQGTASIQSLGGLRIVSGVTPIASLDLGSILMKENPTLSPRLYLNISKCVNFKPKMLFGNKWYTTTDWNTGQKIDYMAEGFVLASKDLLNGGFTVFPAFHETNYDMYNANNPGYSLDGYDPYVCIGETTSTRDHFVKWTILG